MIEAERHSLIVRRLDRDGFLSVREVARLTDVSEATARRDLRDLEAQGELRRVRGGAESVRLRTAAATAPSELDFDRSAVVDLVMGMNRVAPEVSEAETNPVPIKERLWSRVEEKRRIGRAAAELCGEARTIGIDGGSTTFYMAEYLPTKGLTVITNSFVVAEVLNRATSNMVILPGGVLHRDSQLLLDPIHQEFYADYATDILFLGVQGIDHEGLLNTDARVIQAVRQMICHARKVVVLADSSKFRHHGHARICGFDRVHTLITDSGIDEEHREFLRSHGIELIVA
jgi:DeoR family ulaG and ulaABCDEF operon transcriptional repressor